MNAIAQMQSNIQKTWLIMSLFVVFITTLIYIYAKASGDGIGLALIAFIISAAMSFISYFYSDKMILGMSGAKEIKERENPKLFKAVRNLSENDNLPMPKVYIIKDTAINAFATGRDPKHAVVCATTGAIERLNEAELEGVIAHELSHVKNFDIRLMSIVVILVGVVALLADMFTRSLWYGRRDNDDNKGNSIFLIIGIIFALLSPIIATLIQLAVSRKRELLADASGVLLTRYPEGLASALEKIQHDKEPLEAANNATAHLYIANPFKADNHMKNWFSGLFNTHPPIEERIRILRSM